MVNKNIDLSVVLHDDSDYKDWLAELKERFYSHRLKASCATNGYLLDFYWKLGRDIEAKQYTNTYGSGFYKNLSLDLKNEDPYQLDFLNLREKYDERDIEDELVNNVTRFLLELGKGFSYMGRQFRLEVGQQEFFPDLLFYNAHLHAYVVIELKAQSFHPSFLGQLSFYVSAINHQFKTDIDNPTIGLLICKDKDSVVAKYALDSYKEPMGISEYQLSKLFPKDFKFSMPTIEELEKGLKDNVEHEKGKTES